MFDFNLINFDALKLGFLLANCNISVIDTFEASGAPETRNVNGEPGTCSPAYLIVSACRPAS